jgi:hypothetical protein
LKLVNISCGSDKEAKNSNGSYPTEFVFEVIFQKAGEHNFSLGHP